MRPFRTIIHPTDFDEPSKEAFRVARSLAQALGAQGAVSTAAPPPATGAPEGRVIRAPKEAEPVDLWGEYRTLQADTPNLPVQYSVVVAEPHRRSGALAAWRSGEPSPREMTGGT